MNILVTGGCGFIGANLIRVLMDSSYQVRVLDNLSRGSVENMAQTGVEFLQGDIRNRDLLQKSLKSIDVVIHLAAYGSVVESVDDPRANFDVNVMGTFQLLQECVKSGVKRFIFASTGGALIGNAAPPVNERSLPKPISPYGASKLCCEGYIHAFEESYDIETITLRFANAYGPISAHKMGAVTTFMKSIIQKRPIVIYGDGSASRDFLYVDDLCGGIASVLEKDIKSPALFHLASGEETCVSDLAYIICEVSGAGDEYDIEYLPARKGEVTRNFASYELAEKILGFRPKTSLRVGLQETWDWFQREGDRVFEVGESNS